MSPATPIAAARPLPATDEQPEDLTLEQLCHQLKAAKQAEADAIADRREVEEQIVAAIGELPDEGTAKAEAGDYVIKVTCSLSRRVDTNKLDELISSGAIRPEIGKRLVRWKPELETRELRYLEANEPDLYTVAAQAITAKPSKPAVKVEEAH